MNPLYLLTGYLQTADDVRNCSKHYGQERATRALWSPQNNIARLALLLVILCLRTRPSIKPVRDMRFGKS